MVNDFVLIIPMATYSTYSYQFRFLATMNPSNVQSEVVQYTGLSEQYVAARLSFRMVIE